VKIAASRADNSLELVVSDNGKGIPKEVLPLLLNEGATFGKANGNGIGLYHAKELLKQVRGTIRIESEEGKGAEVYLSIPLEKAPPGFVDRLEVPQDALVVMVDDDPLVHMAMNRKLESSLPGFNRAIRLSSANAFEKWFNENGPGDLGKRIYFFDYDLKDAAGNGLDLIERHGLTFESVLISGMTEDLTVRSRITRLGVKWLPKDHLSQVPVVELGGRPMSASYFGEI
jgi:hypothetical protein